MQPTMLQELPLSFISFPLKLRYYSVNPPTLCDDWLKESGSQVEAYVENCF